jgi:VanZ family protein
LAWEEDKTMKITHGGIESEGAGRNEGMKRLKVRAIAVMGWRGMERLRMGRGWMGRRGVWRGAFGVALAFTMFFSLYPHDAVQETFSEEVQAFDWLFHALCYATLSATWLLGRAKRPRGLLPRLDAALAFASLGCVLELAQALLPFVARTCTLSDASANAVGAFLGAFLVPLPGDDSPPTEK